MAPTSPHMHDTTDNYQMSHNKHRKQTYYQVSNTQYYRWANCVMTTALPFFQNTGVQFITNTTDLSSQASEIPPLDYMNSKYPHTTNKTSTRQMLLYQQPTYRNTLNIYINVLSPQQPEHGSRQRKRATSKHGPASLSMASNTSYPNWKQQRLGISTNKEKTYNQRNYTTMTRIPCTHHPHSKRASTPMLYMPPPSATMNQWENYILT